ncbi:MAG: hypothetical protein ACRDKS_03820 [Actinomycetota bacterium]
MIPITAIRLDEKYALYGIELDPIEGILFHEASDSGGGVASREAQFRYLQRLPDGAILRIVAALHRAILGYAIRDRRSIDVDRIRAHWLRTTQRRGTA